MPTEDSKKPFQAVTDKLLEKEELYDESGKLKVAAEPLLKGGKLGTEIGNREVVIDPARNAKVAEINKALEAHFAANGDQEGAQKIVDRMMDELTWDADSLASGLSEFKQTVEMYKELLHSKEAELLDSSKWRKDTKKTKAEREAALHEEIDDIHARLHAAHLHFMHNVYPALETMRLKVKAAVEKVISDEEQAALDEVESEIQEYLAGVNKVEKLRVDSANEAAEAAAGEAYEALLDEHESPRNLWGLGQAAPEKREVVKEVFEPFDDVNDREELEAEAVVSQEERARRIEKALAATEYPKLYKDAAEISLALRRLVHEINPAHRDDKVEHRAKVIFGKTQEGGKDNLDRPDFLAKPEKVMEDILERHNKRARANVNLGEAVAEDAKAFARGVEALAKGVSKGVAILVFGPLFALGTGAWMAGTKAIAFGSDIKKEWKVWSAQKRIERVARLKGEVAKAEAVLAQKQDQDSERYAMAASRFADRERHLQERAVEALKTKEQKKAERQAAAEAKAAQAVDADPSSKVGWGRFFKAKAAKESVDKAAKESVDKAAEALQELTDWDVLNRDTTYYNVRGRLVPEDSTVNDLNDLQLYSSGGEENRVLLFDIGEFQPAYEAAQKRQEGVDDEAWAKKEEVKVKLKEMQADKDEGEDPTPTSGGGSSGGK